MPAYPKDLFRALGPGIVYAAAAVGISHLVQSTRAGAVYGLSMALAMLVIFVIKYPALRIGSDYAAITGRHLIHDYQRQGRWVVYVVAAVTVVTMIFVMASLALVTAGLLRAMTGTAWPDTAVAAVLLVLSSFTLVMGHYRLLEVISKVLVPMFTICILVAFCILTWQLDWRSAGGLVPAADIRSVLFVVLLAGFMPTPLDGSILQSLWTCAKSGQMSTVPDRRAVRMDFNIGYVLSMVLAYCFLVMGASVFYQSGTALEGNAGLFAGQVISLFTTAIGSWAFPLVAFAAFTVMFSTMLTILDGYPRMLTVSVRQLRGESQSGGEDRLFTMLVILNCIASVAVMLLLMKSFQAFIDFTSALVFITGPLFAFLNHRAILGDAIPGEMKPGRLFRAWSMAGIVILAVVAFAYLYIVVFFD